MKVAGIVCEYNPFHKGHKYQMDMAREVTGADYVVCIMSGNFVQRGEPGIFFKEARVKAALAEGADMVLELPFPYACSSAQYFAKGAVSILNATGVVTHLCFGSESGSIEEIRSIKNKSSDFSGVKSLMDRGKSYAEALGILTGTGKGLRNDILGAEYLRALENLSSPIIPVAVKRQPEASASDIREGILSGNILPEDYKKYMPEKGAEIFASEIRNGCGPVSLCQFEKGIFTVIRSGGSEYLKKIPLCSEGIENRIYEKAACCSSVAELISECNSKRYTSGRIKRILMWALVMSGSGEIPSFDSEPPYIRVLGMKKAASSLSAAMGEKASLPYIFSNADAKKISPLFAGTEARATDIYNVFRSEGILPGKTEFTNRMIII